MTTQELSDLQMARIAKAKEITDEFAMRAKHRGEQGGYFRLLAGKHAEGIALDARGIPVFIDLEKGIPEDRIFKQGDVFYSPLDLDKRLNGKGNGSRKFERCRKDGRPLLSDPTMTEIQRENVAAMARIRELEAQIKKGSAND